MVEYDIVNVPIVDIVNQIILYASKNRASDIHMDPHEDSLLIRMRIDGELRNHTEIPKAYERNLITRVKLISNMNITETRLPQDGSIKGRIEDKDLDMRVSVLPTNEGEKVVIRILDYSKSLSGVASLGFSEKNYNLLEQMMGAPNGIILVTGATGSGKSTTTYSILQELNKENTNIITVEDPVEMNIEGINQVQVNSEIGLTFAAVLRSILRQDPNVILIGEIRDSETAQIAVRASITGHLVLSTIHTNNSLNTIERLLDMDVERYLLSSALTGVISQKLARKLCPKCRQLRETTEYEKEIFKLVLNKEVNQVYEAVGCSECTEGYHGRIALHEVLYINDILRSVISNPKTTKEELKDLVYTDDVTTLLGDGLEKIIAGLTTFKELFKLVEVDLEIKALREDIERRKRKKVEKVAEKIIAEEENKSEIKQDSIQENKPLTEENNIEKENTITEETTNNNIKTDNDNSENDDEVIDEDEQTIDDELISDDVIDNSQIELNDVVPDKIQQPNGIFGDINTPPKNNSNLFDLNLDSYEEKEFFDE